MNRVAADFCRSSCNTEDLAFSDIVAFDVVGNNQISYAQVVTFGDIKQRITIFHTVCACCKCCSLCVLLAIYTGKTRIDALLLFSGIGCDTCCTSAFGSHNSLNLFGFRSRFSNSRCRFLRRLALYQSHQVIMLFLNRSNSNRFNCWSRGYIVCGNSRRGQVCRDG